MNIKVRNISKIILFAICLICAPFCNAQGEDIIISGEIDADFASSVALASSSNIDLIKIKSHGGKEHYALIVAKILMESNISVEVIEQCYSACATIILPAAEVVYVDSRDQIGIHHSSYGIWNSQRVERSKIKPTIEIYDNYQKTIELYQNVGGNLRWLDTALEIVRPTCINYGIQRSVLYTQATFWMPPKFVLEELGISFSSSSKFNSAIQYSGALKAVPYSDGKVFMVGSGNLEKEYDKIAECE